jgi:hypothetical protein
MREVWKEANSEDAEILTCKQMLTGRGLRSDPKPATQKTDKKQSEAVSAKEPEPKPILTAYEMRMLKIRERQEKIRQLASQAF